MPETAVLSRRTFLKTACKAAVAFRPGVDFVQKRSTVAVPNYPLPKFWFQQEVGTTWTSDESGKSFYEQGLIIGLAFVSPGNPMFLQEDGWIYWVKWRNPQVFESFDWIAEDELEAL